MNLQPVANGLEALPLVRLGALPITDVQRSRIVVARRQGSADARVHAAAEQYNRTRLALVRQTLRPPSWPGPI